MSKNHEVLIAIRDKDSKGSLSNMSSNLIELQSWVDSQEGMKSKPSKTKKETIVSKGKSAEELELSEEIINLSNNFKQAMAGFRSVTVLASTMGTLIPSMMFDENVRSYSESKGDLLEVRGSYRIYGIGGGDTHELFRSINKLHETDHGLDQLPAGLLLGVVAFYDSFVKDLLKLLLKQNPERYNKSEKKIPLSELLSLSSFDEMIDKVIEDDLTDMLRGSHEEHSDYIKKTFGFDLSKNFSEWSFYLELFERRNLVAHNNLVVDKQYVRNRSRQGSAGQSVGDRLVVDSAYVAKTVDVLTEAGARLLFHLWNKFSSKNATDTYDHMVEFGYELILSRAYSPAIGLFSHILDESNSSSPEKARRMMAVNLANACKLSENKEGMESALARFQWDSVSDQFQICVAAVRDDVPGVVSRMSRVSDENLVGKAGFRTWPVFRSARKNKLFRSEFEKIYGEPIFSTNSDADRSLDDASSTMRRPKKVPLKISNKDVH